MCSSGLRPFRYPWVYVVIKLSKFNSDVYDVLDEAFFCFVAFRNRVSLFCELEIYDIEHKDTSVCFCLCSPVDSDLCDKDKLLRTVGCLCVCVCKGGALCTRATRVSQLFPLTSAELHAHRDPLFSLSVILSYHLPSDLHENIYNVPWNDLPLSNDEPTDAISKTLFRVAEWCGK